MQRAVKADWQRAVNWVKASMADFHREDTLQPELGTKYFFVFKY